MFFQLKNFTGAVYLNEKNEVNRKGGIMYTIKGGVIYDSKKLLADVKNGVPVPYPS
jgi:butyrate kinase